MNINPNFAEVLMSTFYAGGDMSNEDYIKCQKIWNDCNNDRSKVLKVVVELCGNIDTPQTRYLKAIAWSFNRVEYSEQRIEAINNYLNNKLYKKAYETLRPSIEKGIKYGEKCHISNMLKYKADAYCHLKQYDKEEEAYINIYNLGIIIPNCCVSLASYYSKRKQIEKAIDLLKKERNTIKYITNKEYREPIDKYLDELEKKQKGIKKHSFYGYDSWSGPFLGLKDNPVYHPELENKIKELRSKYKNIFLNHKEFLENIDFYEAKIKKYPDDVESKEEFTKNCLSDINIFPNILNYYKEYNKIGFADKIDYSDNHNKEYPIFKKIILFYEKENNIKDAITLCDIAINYGITKFHGKMGMKEKKEKLNNKLE